MEFARMLAEDHQPSEEEILAAIGAGELWSDLKEYIDQSYEEGLLWQEIWLDDPIPQEWQNSHFSLS